MRNRRKRYKCRREAAIGENRSRAFVGTEGRGGLSTFLEAAVSLDCSGMIQIFHFFVCSRVSIFFIKVKG